MTLRQMDRMWRPVVLSPFCDKSIFTEVLSGLVFLFRLLLINTGWDKIIQF